MENVKGKMKKLGVKGGCRVHGEGWNSGRMEK
jgi:hypothetical protein